MPLFSIGHSNHPAERFLALLAQAGIDTLVDVRSRPSSRFCPQFNRAALERALGGAAIEYRYLGDALGGRDGVSVEDPAFVAAMCELLESARSQCIALMCSEREPERCHRTTKLAAWVHRHEPSASLTHLVPRADGTLDRIDSRELEARLAPSLLWPELRPGGLPFA
jgi:uncharacterized protein (DUF488 family)